MTQIPGEDELVVTGLKSGRTYVSEIVYFTGGLVGIPVQGGLLAMLPLRGEQAINDLTWLEFNVLAKKCGTRHVGSNQTSERGQGAPAEFWSPSIGTAGGLSGSDSWGAIAGQAHRAGDFEYRDLARYTSTSMYAAGIRLRDIAKAHHDQLRWALAEGKKPGLGFSNVAMLDLYLGFHSLASELCAVRDFLASLGAVAIKANGNIDSMARLAEYCKKPSNAAFSDEPFVALLFRAWGDTGNPSWLQKLGTVRNELIHRRPMSANPEAAMLRIKSVETEFGAIETIRLAPSVASGLDVENTPDPFETILDFYNQMELLVRDAAEIARYKPKLITLTTS